MGFKSPLGHHMWIYLDAGQARSSDRASPVIGNR